MDPRVKSSIDLLLKQGDQQALQGYLSTLPEETRQEAARYALVKVVLPTDPWGNSDYSSFMPGGTLKVGAAKAMGRLTPAALASARRIPNSAAGLMQMAGSTGLGDEFAKVFSGAGGAAKELNIGKLFARTGAQAQDDFWRARGAVDDIGAAATEGAQAVASGGKSLLGRLIPSKKTAAIGIGLGGAAFGVNYMSGDDETAALEAELAALEAGDDAGIVAKNPAGGGDDGGDLEYLVSLGFSPEEARDLLKQQALRAMTGASGSGGGSSRAVQTPEETRLLQLEADKLQRELDMSMDPRLAFDEEIRQFDTQEGRLRDALSQAGYQFDRRHALDQQQYGLDADLGMGRLRVDEGQLAESIRANQAREAAQARQQNLADQQYIGEVLRKPSDFLARAFMSRGEKSPLPQVTQADLLRTFKQGGGQGMVPGMSTGGATREGRFIVGDSVSGSPTGVEEMIVNPTNAPIQVVPMNVPRFARGTGAPRLLGRLVPTRPYDPLDRDAAEFDDDQVDVTGVDDRRWQKIKRYATGTGALQSTGGFTWDPSGRLTQAGPMKTGFAPGELPKGYGNYTTGKPLTGYNQQGNWWDSPYLSTSTQPGTRQSISGSGVLNDFVTPSAGQQDLYRAWNNGAFANTAPGGMDFATWIQAGRPNVQANAQQASVPQAAPMTQEQLVAMGRTHLPPAARQLLLGEKIAAARPAVGGITPGRLQRLTPDEMEALNSQLGLEYNTTLENELALMGQRGFGTSVVSQRRGRFVA